jgi:hypothetical protein
MTFNNTTPSNFFDTSANARATSSPFVDVFQPRDPTSSDITSATSINNYATQQRWLNTATNTLWELKSYNSANGITTANWIKIGGSNIVETLTGNNTSVQVPPTSFSSSPPNNIYVEGDGVYLTVTGDAATNTLTVSPAGGIATLYTEDTGTASAMSGNLNVFGGTGIATSGSGNTITITNTGSHAVPNYTNVTHAMSPYTVNVTTPPLDFYLSVDCSLGPVTLNFPNSPTFKQIWIVKDRTGNASVNNITITTPGGIVTIDESTSYLIASNNASVNLLANATPTYEVW